MFKFPAVSGPASPYYNEFVNGATLVPRSLWFVECRKRPSGIWVFDRNAPYVETTPTAQRLAKPPWKVHLEGKVENRFLFATVLAENLLPFGVRAFSLVVLPVVEAKDGSLRMLNHLDILGQGALEAHSWVKKAEEIWERRKKRSQPSLQEYLDWQQKLTRQKLRARCAVLYATSGTNVVAAVVRPVNAKRVGDAPVSGFIADTVTYRYYPHSEDEANYLAGILNSEVLNQKIKPYQPQGLWGERHIHRRPFEVCPIPRFDPKNPLHRRIAKTAEDAERQLKRWLSGIKGTAARARAAARQLVKPQLAHLDDLVRQLFGEAESAPPKRAKRGNPGSSSFLSMLF